MWWPWFLGAAVLLTVAGLCARDRLSVLICGLWAGGIILTVLTGLEGPYKIEGQERWLVVAAIWTMVSVVASWRYGAELAALALWCIPMGYFALAVGTGPLELFYGITEVAGVTAAVVGSRGIPGGISSRLRNRRHNRNRGLVVGR